MQHVDNLGEKGVKNKVMKVLAGSDKGKVRDQNEDYFYISDANKELGIFMLADRNGTDMKAEKLQVGLQLMHQENI